MRIAGLILAGGQGRRMGSRDKALLPLAGQPLLAHVADRLSGQVAILAISANGDPGRFTRFGFPVLPDGVPDAGPLAGVLAGLEWAWTIGAEALLTVPVDTPFVPRDLCARLGAPPSFAVGPERAHHLLALWPCAAVAALRAHLSRPGSRAVARFADSIGVRAVPFPSEAPFRNVNTPADLAEAEQHQSPGGH